MQQLAFQSKTVALREIKDIDRCFQRCCSGQVMESNPPIPGCQHDFVRSCVHRFSASVFLIYSRAERLEQPVQVDLFLAVMSDVEFFVLYASQAGTIQIQLIQFARLSKAPPKSDQEFWK